MNSVTAKMSEKEFPAITQILLLNEEIQLNDESIKKRFSKLVNDPDVEVIGDSSREGAVIVSWKNRAFTVIAVNAPVQPGTFDSAQRTGYGLGDMKELIAAHRAHLIISPLTACAHTEDAVTIAINQMKIALALATLHPVQGYYWVQGQTLVDGPGFEKALSGVKDALSKQARSVAGSGYSLPLPYWVGFNVSFDEAAGKSDARSRGLASFLGYELVLKSLSMKPSKAAAMLYSIAGYFITSGHAIKDGESVNVSGFESFSVSLSPSHDGNVSVAVLTPA